MQLMKKYKVFIPYVIAVFTCLFVTFPAASNSIVLDEAYSAVLVRGNVSDIIQGAASDVHPPLYYLILKASEILGGESLLKYRIVTAMGTYLNVLLLGTVLIRRRWGCRVSILYILWFGMTYGTLERSTFLRMYTWGAFFVTATALFLFRYYEKNRKRDIFAGIAMTLAAMYTHYYAVISVFLMWAVLLLFTFLKKRKTTGFVLLGGVIVTLGYLPWLKTLLSQSKRVADHYWMSGFDWSEWRQVPAALMESSDEAFIGIGMVLYSFLIILLFLALFKRKWDALICVAVFFGTMLAGAFFSVFITPIWATRYMYVDWGLIALFAAVTAGEVTSVFSNISQGFLILILAITGGVSAHTMLVDETMSSTADEWVVFLEDNVNDDACLIVDNPSEHLIVFRFYLPNADFVFTEKLLNQGAEAGLESFLSQSAGHQIWYVIDYRQQKIGTEKMQAYLEELGYTFETAGTFTIEHKSLEVFKVEEKGHEG